MAAFEKVKLATGEFRADYIQRRLKDGATPKAIIAEINAPGLYSGPAGKVWGETVVYAEKRKLSAPASVKAATASAPLTEPDAPDLEPALIEVEVPPEYEDILSAADVAEVKAEAVKKLKAKQREQAKKDLLARATQELEREARLAAQRGSARGDLVDVMIDLAPYAVSIKLDGVEYRHGTTVRVNRKVAAVLFEQIQRSWAHQDSISGKNERPYRRNLADRGITANNVQQVTGLRA